MNMFQIKKGGGHLRGVTTATILVFALLFLPLFLCGQEAFYDTKSKEVAEKYEIKISPTMFGDKVKVPKTIDKSLRVRFIMLDSKVMVREGQTEINLWQLAELKKNLVDVGIITDDPPVEVFLLVLRQLGAIEVDIDEIDNDAMFKLETILFDYWDSLRESTKITEE